MIKIEKMSEKFVPAVAELERNCFSMPWSERSIAGELVNPLALWLVAVEDGKLVGYIGSQAVMDEADVMNVAVDMNYRRRGIGEALVKELVALLKKSGIRCLTLEVRAGNEPAVTLYEKLGFVQVGRRPGYYQKPKEDALILRKEWEI